MAAFERMWARLPDVLKSEDIKGLYVGMGDIFDLLEIEQSPYIYINVLSQMSGSMLDLYGSNFGISRMGKDDSGFKRVLGIELAKLKFVPTLNNFIEFITKITGYQMRVTEGWKLDPPEKATLKVLITVPAGSDDSLLIDLKSLYSCGIKLDWVKTQESFAPWEYAGTHNDVGIDKIYKGNTRFIDIITKPKGEGENGK